MRYLALATDYDSTLATDSRVNKTTVAALERVLASGRKLILVTGRELEDLQSVCPHLDLFEWVVAENGALLYRPSDHTEKTLGAAPPEKFIRELDRHGVRPLGVGRVIVATREPHEKAVLEVIHDLGLELQVIFNKGAVMVLPSGVNKATGLAAALKELGLSPHNVVGVGDAENDHAFLTFCECSVAVANALPQVKETADFVTKGHHGAGVIELIGRLVEEDLRAWDERLKRHHLLLGTKEDGSEVRTPPYAGGLLIAGPSGSGKSTAATSFLEQLVEQKYQFCILDPEGDYEDLEGSITLGNSRQAPTPDEVLRSLGNPETNLAVNLIGLPLADRPAFFQTLLPHLLELRIRTGRPHWLIIDEAHHLLPASWQPTSSSLPQELDRVVLITVHPDHVAPALLALVETVIAVGAAPGETLRQFCTAVGEAPPRVAAAKGESGEVVVWSRRAGRAPVRVRVPPSRTERRRHTRKYAEGELPPELSFFFRGPKGKLNLRAQNLILFMQLADGVDDDTWVYHLRRGDYAAWFREKIKDEELAAEAERVAKLTTAKPGETRALIKAAIEQRYTLPASPSFPVPGTAFAKGRTTAGSAKNTVRP
jgi:hydroxymethylpyrimidine pyrophosphatase-like HAD family hydrolase